MIVLLTHFIAALSLIVLNLSSLNTSPSSSSSSELRLLAGCVDWTKVLDDLVDPVADVALLGLVADGGDEAVATIEEEDVFRTPPI